MSTHLINCQQTPQDTPNSEQESVADESSASAARKNLSFAGDEFNEVRYYDNRDDPPAYDHDLDGSDSSSRSDSVEVLGIRRDNGLRIQEDDDDDEDDDQMTQPPKGVQDYSSQAEESRISGNSTLQRPKTTVNHEWLTILPEGAVLKELGGNGECLLKSICYAIYGSVDCQDYLRLAIMKELSNNKEYYQPYCLLENSSEIFPIPEYVVIHSKKDAYCGGLEILACCNLQKVRIRVYIRHYLNGYQDFN